MADETTTPAPSGGKKTLIVLVVSSLLAAAAGGAAPLFLLKAGERSEHGNEGGHHGAGSKHAYVAFGDSLVVNLNEDRLTRYLRTKILLVVDEHDEKYINELVTKKKPALRNWLLASMSDKSLQEVSGASGQNKLRREIWQHFNSELFPDGSEKILDIFFEEFVVQ
jgi:flagellar protein FliL